MKILRLFTALFIAAMTIAACDDTTDNIGSSITNDVDNISIKDQVFNVTSRSFVSGPVLSRNNTGMIGNVKDPETGTYVAGDYMTQFGVLSSFSLDTLEYIRNAHDGKIEADSCYLLVSYKTTYGDTLAPNIYKALKASVEFAKNHTVQETHDKVVSDINAVEGLEVEYFQIVDGDSLQDVASWEDSAYVVGCITVYCGKTPIRLIDHIKYKG